MMKNIDVLPVPEALFGSYCSCVKSQIDQYFLICIRSMITL